LKGGQETAYRGLISLNEREPAEGERKKNSRKPLTNLTEIPEARKREISA